MCMYKLVGHYVFMILLGVYVDCYFISNDLSFDMIFFYHLSRVHNKVEITFIV